MTRIPIIFTGLLTLYASFLLMSPDVSSSSEQSPAAGLQTQAQLRARVAAHRADPLAYVKRQALVGWVLRSCDPADLPPVIAEHLGEVDHTGYSPDYLAANQGSVIALQMKGEAPDFYMIAKSTFETVYATVPLADALRQNPALNAWIAGHPALATRLKNEPGALVGAHKAVEVEMLVLSDLGYPVSAAVTLQSPWGRQTKPAGQDGFLAVDKASGDYYLVNQDEDGNPLSYQPAR